MYFRVPIYNIYRYDSFQYIPINKSYTYKYYKCVYINIYNNDTLTNNREGTKIFSKRLKKAQVFSQCVDKYYMREKRTNLREKDYATYR